MKGILLDTYRDLMDRKMIYIYIIINLLTAFAYYITSDVDIPDQFVSPAEVTAGSISGFLTLLIFITVLGTAGLVPDMLSKGKSEYFLSKPMSRTSILVSKLLSIFLVYSFILFVSYAFISLVTLMLDGTALFSTIYIFLFQLLSFIIWLILTISVGVISGSFSFSIIAAFLMAVSNLIIVGILKAQELSGIFNERAILSIAKVVYLIIPNNNDIVDAGAELFVSGKISNWEPIYSSIIFSILLFSGAIYVFKRKSY